MALAPYVRPIVSGVASDETDRAALAAWIEGLLAGYALSSHTQAVSTISDSGATGRALVQAATAAIARAALDLGTAATTAATDYATAAQGVKADASVQLTGAQTVAGVKTFSSAPVVPDGAFAIAKVNGLQAALDGKATAAQGVKADAAAPQTALDAEVSARAAADTALGLRVDRIALGDRARPGENPEQFSADLTGDPEDRTPLSADLVAVDDDAGACWRIVGAGIVAPRRAFTIEADRIYKVRVVYKRLMNSADPSGDAVQVKWRNLNRNKATVSTITVNTSDNPLAASGLMEVEFLISTDTEVEGVAVIPPATARYGLPYLETFGDTPETGAVLFEFYDVTDQTLGGADVATLTAGLAAEAQTRGDVDETLEGLAYALTQPYDDRDAFEAISAPADMVAGAYLGPDGRPRRVVTDAAALYPVAETLDGKKWVADGPRTPGHHGVTADGPMVGYDPNVTRATVAGGDGLYRHEASFTQAADGTLHAFWQGHPTDDHESQPGQKIYHATSADGGATWSSPATVDTETATNVLTFTSIPAISRCITVGSEVWLYFANRGTSEEEALIWGRLSAAGSWTWARARSVDATGALEFSTTDLSGAAASGYSLTYPIEGVDVQLTPTCVRQREDGQIDLMLVGIFGAFAVRHYAFNVRLTAAGAVAEIGSSIPLGPDNIAAPWEVSVVQDDSGAYVAHGRRQLYWGGLSGVPLTRGERQWTALSSDGLSWSAPEITGLQTHSARAHMMRVDWQRWAFACTGAWSVRNDVSVGFTSDPKRPAIGCLVSAEDVTTHYAEYPQLGLFSSGGTRYIGVTYSQRLQSASAPTDIIFAYFSAPTPGSRLGMTASQRGNRADPAAVSSLAGGIITIPPKASMMWEPTEYRCERRAIRWRVDTVPAGVPYLIAGIGNAETASLIYLSSSGSDFVIRMDSRTLFEVADPTAWQTLTLELDYDAGTARINGVIVDLEKSPVGIYSGDAFELTGFSSGTSGNLLIDVSASTVYEVASFDGMDAKADGGANIFINPRFAVDQIQKGAPYGNGVGHKMDGVYLSDNGGCGLSISRGEFSVASAGQNAGGVQSHLRIRRTSTGTGNPVFDLTMGDLSQVAGTWWTAELDAYDSGGLAYAMEVHALNNFGTGDGVTAPIRTRVGVLLVDAIAKRHTLRFFWPSVSSGVTVGANPFAALQLTPWIGTIVADADLRLGRIDQHRAARSRPFPRTCYARDIEACHERLWALRAEDAFAVFELGLAFSTTQARFPLRHPKMRAQPTLSTVGSFQIVNGTTTVAATGLSIARKADGSLDLVATVASGLTVNVPSQIRDAGDGTAVLALRAGYQ